MSRITNDTRLMQTALTSISSDIFKQPVAIIGGVSVLLYMDWKFTVVTLILFPSCIMPLQFVWQAGAQSGQRRAGRDGPDGGDDAGDLRWNPGREIVRARRAPEKSFDAVIAFSSTMRCALCVRLKPSARWSNRLLPLEWVSPSFTFTSPVCRQPKFFGAHRRHLPPLRSDQNSESSAYHDAAFDPGDGGNFPGSRFDSDSPGPARRGRPAPFARFP